MNTGTSLARRLQEGWTRLADRVFGETSDAETARGEFTSAFISDKSLADYRASEDQRRNAYRRPVL